MSMQLCISTKASKSNISGNWDLLLMTLGQWWGLQAGALQLWAWVSGRVYMNWSLDVLEGSFALNLII